MGWCETKGVDYVFAPARHARLCRRISNAMRRPQAQPRRTSRAARLYTESRYRTCDSWSRARPVVAKAAQIAGKQNPRYVVTSWAASAWRPRPLYEQLYCARGQMENRIKQQLLLFADRMSAETLRANQLRLYLSAAAYVLVEALRRQALQGTEMARAQLNTVRLRLLRIGAQIRFTARRVLVLMASAYPYRAVCAHVCRALRCWRRLGRQNIFAPQIAAVGRGVSAGRGNTGQPALLQLALPSQTVWKSSPTVIKGLGARPTALSQHARALNRHPIQNM